MNQLVPVANTNAEAYRASTDAAGLCREIVKQTAKPIQGKRYVSVEGWQAIAIAHGCAASALDVSRVNDEGMSGFKCIGVVRRMSDGQEIARAEGFLGDDEKTWSSRTVHARRAMVQTRAISRACRSAFAHVVVMIDNELSTTPAEEMSHDNGETIEAKTVDPNDPRREPAAREVLEGPHKNKTALRNAINNGVRLVRLCNSVEELDALLAKGAKDIAQAERYWPALLNGFPDIPEDIGFHGEVAKRRAELAPDTGYKALVESMTETDTKPELEAWIARNIDKIANLDDVESRRFQTAKDLHESVIDEMDTARA